LMLWSMRKKGLQSLPGLKCPADVLFVFLLDRSRWDGAKPISREEVGPLAHKRMLLRFAYPVGAKIRQSGRNRFKRQDLANSAAFDSFLGHTKNDARGLILRDGVSTCLAHLEQSLGAGVPCRSGSHPPRHFPVRGRTGTARSHSDDGAKPAARQ